MVEPRSRMVVVESGQLIELPLRCLWLLSLGCGAAAFAWLRKA